MLNDIRNGYTSRKKWKIVRGWLPCLKSFPLCPILPKTYNMKRRRARWVASWWSLSSMRITTWWAYLKICSRTRFRLKWKYPERRVSSCQILTIRSWRIIGRASEHWKISNNPNLTWSLNSFNKRNSFSSWA